MTFVLYPIPGVVSGPNPPYQDIDRPWKDYPLGTEARARLGGFWLRVAAGWQWMGGTQYAGDTFPTPGAEAYCVQLPLIEPE